MFLCQYRPFNGENIKEKENTSIMQQIIDKIKNKKECFYSSATHDYYIKPTCCKQVLHNRHGQFGFHFLMPFLKEYRD